MQTRSKITSPFRDSKIIPTIKLYWPEEESKYKDFNESFTKQWMGNNHLQYFVTLCGVENSRSFHQDRMKRDKVGEIYVCFEVWPCVSICMICWEKKEMICLYEIVIFEVSLKRSIMKIRLMIDWILTFQTSCLVLPLDPFHSVCIYLSHRCF